MGNGALATCAAVCSIRRARHTDTSIRIGRLCEAHAGLTISSIIECKAHVSIWLAISSSFCRPLSLLSTSKTMSAAGLGCPSCQIGTSFLSSTMTPRS
jgi:hypothetical protein